jgi:hypothetical protein
MQYSQALGLLPDHWAPVICTGFLSPHFISIAWFHSTFISFFSHAYLGMFEYQFSAVLLPNSLNVGDVDVYRLYHVL